MHHFSWHEYITSPFYFPVNHGVRARPFTVLWGTLFVTIVSNVSLNQVQFSSTDLLPGWSLKKSSPSCLARSLNSSLSTLFQRGSLRGGFGGTVVLVWSFARMTRWSLIPVRDETSEIKSGCEVNNRSRVFSVPLDSSRLVGKVTFLDKWLLIRTWARASWRAPLGSLCVPSDQSTPGTFKSPPRMMSGERNKEFIFESCESRSWRGATFESGGR